MARRQRDVDNLGRRLALQGPMEALDVLERGSSLRRCRWLRRADAPAPGLLEAQPAIEHGAEGQQHALQLVSRLAFALEHNARRDVHGGSKLKHSSAPGRQDGASGGSIGCGATLQRSTTTHLRGGRDGADGAAAIRVSHDLGSSWMKTSKMRASRGWAVCNARRRTIGETRAPGARLHPVTALATVRRSPEPAPRVHGVRHHSCSRTVRGNDMDPGRPSGRCAHLRAGCGRRAADVDPGDRSPFGAAQERGDRQRPRRRYVRECPLRPKPDGTRGVSPRA